MAENWGIPGKNKALNVSETYTVNNKYLKSSETTWYLYQNGFSQKIIIIL